MDSNFICKFYLIPLFYHPLKYQTIDYFVFESFYKMYKPHFCNAYFYSAINKLICEMIY